ncbi:DUF7351 domain-containing protein [Halorarum halobium]|uniref:DUF7351 domain-containing protein n=1 Tax=Halorarum halobium TaxID=3075121 RepID=UPI0028A73B94|nr:hypothetical protein [Halobaculum sp. XH14]
MTEPPTEDDAFFDTVSNTTRREILRGLAGASGDDPTDPWVGYAELREAVGIRDTGNFNYHLDRLGSLIEKGDPGYRVTRTGMEAIATVATGDLDPDYAWGPVEAPGSCHVCGDPVRLVYGSGVLRLTCGAEDHERRFSISPALLETHPDGRLVEHVAFAVNRLGALLRHGICSECQGYVDGTVEPHPRHVDRYHYHGRCERCEFRHGQWIGGYLISHPDVVSFYRDHDVDVRSVPHWTLEFCDPGSETVVSTDPLRLRVEITHEDTTFDVTVDGDGSVTRTNPRAH